MESQEAKQTDIFEMTEPFVVDHAALQETWEQYVKAQSEEKAACDEYWLTLQSLMAEPQRAYHNLFHMHLLTGHTRNLVKHWQAHLPQAKATKFAHCFTLAVWFHDAIY